MNSILVLSFPCKSRAAYLSMFRNSAVFSPAAVIWIAIALAAAATAVSDRIKRVLGLPGGGDPPWLSGRQVRLETLHFLSLGKLLPVSLPPPCPHESNDPNGFSVSQPDRNRKATSRQRVG